MDTLILLGIILGIAAGIASTSYYYKQKNNKYQKEQSVILLNRIKQVLKLITVEGEFSEIFTHRDGKNVFFNLVQREKKAILIIKAKVMVGFNLSLINIDINSQNKKVKLSQFPQPEIVSIDTDLEYYDIQKGIINKLSENDLTEINKKSKDFIREKVAQSDLFIIAQNQANDTILFIKQLIESIGWEIVSDIILDESDQKKQIEN